MIDSPQTRTLDTWLDEHHDELIAFRRHLHAHPELSYQEHVTTSTIEERLDAAAVTHRRLSLGTGLIADLGTGDRGRLALRADIDALGMSDDKDVPYRSQVDGVAHACGHDVHTTIVLGTALYFARHPEELPGPVRFVFQPAEEKVPGGAVDVIGDGGIDGVDAIIGLHCWPKFDAGHVGVRDGAMTSAADMVEITLTGPGGHTARPHETVDLIPVAAKVVVELPAAVAAAVGGPDQIRFVFGSAHAGQASNVIPSTAVLRASLRTPVLSVWESLPTVVGTALAEILDGTGAGHELVYTSGVPPVFNDPAVTDTVRQAARDEFGDAAVHEPEQSWGGDDFAWYSKQIPATYVRLGTHDPSETFQRDLHVGDFDVDERAIATGIRLLVATVRRHFA